jgi:glycosyltransferase involved in cell wall biosynthesis
MILLSICIPTYNRADILNSTLNSIITDVDFDFRIEIIISDNASTDHTYDICKKFTNIYSNIHYYRNDENIIDKNFTKVLSYGSGLYLKLLNDSIILKKGTLTFFLKKILLFKEKNIPIFFYEKIHFISNKSEESCKNINDLIAKSSYFTTWIANFGIWKNDFNSLENINKFSTLKLLQVDWTFRIVNEKGSKLFFNNYYDVAKVNNKGGYNVFEVFVNNYLSICELYVNSGKLDTFVFSKEKYRLFRFFCFGLVKSTIIDKNLNYNFKTEDAYKILYNNYKYKIYFYFSLIPISLLFFITKIKKLNKRLNF